MTENIICIVYNNGHCKKQIMWSSKIVQSSMKSRTKCEQNILTSEFLNLWVDAMPIPFKWATHNSGISCLLGFMFACVAFFCFREVLYFCLITQNFINFKEFHLCTHCILIIFSLCSSPEHPSLPTPSILSQLYSWMFSLLLYILLILVSATHVLMGDIGSRGPCLTTRRT